jgi:acylphosphatase
VRQNAWKRDVKGWAKNLSKVSVVFCKKDVLERALAEEVRQEDEKKEQLVARKVEKAEVEKAEAVKEKDRLAEAHAKQEQEH